MSPSSSVSMETCTSSLLPPQSSFFPSKHHLDPPNFSPKPRSRYVLLRLTSLPPLAALKTPKGFDPQPNKKKTKKRQKPTRKGPIDDDDEDEEEDEENVVPEIVTNRMMSRIAVAVGTPLLIGVMFFVLFYYLKTGLKIDVPTWIPFLVSFGFYGTALLGVSYGIVSSSWDPLREGSFLGWNEAQKNWPVFWQSIWRDGSNKK